MIKQERLKMEQEEIRAKRRKEIEDRVIKEEDEEDEQEDDDKEKEKEKEKNEKKQEIIKIEDNNENKYNNTDNEKHNNINSNNEDNLNSRINNLINKSDDDNLIKEKKNTINTIRNSDWKKNDNEEKNSKILPNENAPKTNIIKEIINNNKIENKINPEEPEKLDSNNISNLKSNTNLKHNYNNNNIFLPKEKTNNIPFEIQEGKNQNQNDDKSQPIKIEETFKNSIRNKYKRRKIMNSNN